MTAATPAGARDPAGARRRALLLGPAYAWLALTIFLPLSAMLLFSVLEVAPFGERSAVFTLAHYATFLERDYYRFLTWRSLRLGLEVTFWCVALGYPAALALARHVPGRWREALFLLVVLPFWSSALVRTFSWTMVLRDDGFLHAALRLLDPQLERLDLLFTWPAMVIGLVHAYLPYMILTCYVSIQAVDESLLEAARTLGAGPMTVFRRVLLPLSLPGLAAGTVLVFVPVIGSFMEPRILGGRAGTMLGTVIEDQFTVVFNWPRGAALSFILLAIVLATLALASPVLRRGGRPAGRA